jgi:hypothetical protein
LSWKKYQNELATVEEITRWFTQCECVAGIGIVTGKISGIIVIDFDAGSNESALDIFDVKFSVLSKTPHGKHAIFRHPGVDVKNRTDLFGNNCKIDIRADGGYIVAPPSKTEGGEYKWINSMNEFPLTDLPNELIEIINNKPTSPTFIEANPVNLLEGVGEGKRNETAAKIAGSIVAKLNPAEWGTSGWQELKEWNLLNRPPLGEKELKKTFDSICRREAEKKMAQNRVQGANTDDKETIKRKLGEPMSLTELCEKDFPLTPWIVHDLIDRGSINMISAAPNQYKSWIVHHIALALAQGAPVFGYFKTEKQNVLIVNEEDPERLIKSRSLMLEKRYQNLPVYFYIQKGFKLTEENVPVLLELIKKYNIDFVIFDSLRSIHDFEENSSTEMQKVADLLKEFSKKDLTILFTHHNRKKNRFPGKEEDSLGEETRGSSAINAAVHSHLSCDPIEIEGKKYIVLSQRKLKCAEKLKPFKVEIVLDEFEGKNFGLVYAGEFRQSAEAVNKKKKIVLEEITRRGTWTSFNDLVDKKIALKNDKTARQALKFLVAEKLIIEKTKTELEENGVNIEGRSNEKFYKVVTEEPAIQKTLDGW